MNYILLFSSILALWDNILYLTEQYTNQSLTAAAVALTHSEYNLSHICPRHAPAEFATALQGCMSKLSKLFSQPFRMLLMSASHPNKVSYIHPKEARHLKR